MKKHTDKLELNSFYHIYNRGNNGVNIFAEEKNYVYFLKKYIKYIHPFVDTFAYCLLRNHFHIIVRIKGERELQNIIPKENIMSLEAFVSKQFSHFFNGYAQGFNKMYERTGALFESPFRRLKIDHVANLKNVIAYIHFNPQLHKMIDDFRNWKHSSFVQYLSADTTRLKKDEVLSWFGGIESFNNFHNQKFELQEQWKIESEL